MEDEFQPPAIIKPDAPNYSYQETVNELKTPEITPDVELWPQLEQVKPPENKNNREYSSAIMYGQGPILDKETKTKAAEAAKEQGSTIEAEINTWGKITGVAAGYLYEKGLFREAFFSGGETGGKGYGSEAEHMHKAARDVFGDDLIPDEDVHTDSAGNTLDNVALTLNQMDRFQNEGYESGDLRAFDKTILLGSSFHTPRINKLAGLFNMENVTVMSSEAVVSTMAHDSTITKDQLSNAATVLMEGYDSTDKSENDLRQDILDWVEERTDYSNIDLNRPVKVSEIKKLINDGDMSTEDLRTVARFAQVKLEKNDQKQIGELDKAKIIDGLETLDDDHRIPAGEFTSFVGGGETLEERYEPYGHFEKAEAEEAKSPIKRAYNEDMFTQGLLDVPENWLGYVGLIEDNDRLYGILHNVQEWNPDLLSTFVEDGEPLIVLPDKPKEGEDQTEFKTQMNQIRKNLEPYRRMSDEHEDGKRLRVHIDQGLNEETSEKVDAFIEFMNRKSRNESNAS